MCELQEGSIAPPHICVNVVEKGEEAISSWLRCAVGENLFFDTERMECDFFFRAEPVLHDALVVCAAVEFCDRIKPRPEQGWARHFSLKIPVCDLDRWLQSSVTDTLRDALQFLTGDRWDLQFYRCKKPFVPPRHGLLNLCRAKNVVIPFSNGLDSWIAAGLAAMKWDDRVARVRVIRGRPSKKNLSPNGIDRRKVPFTVISYNVGFENKNQELKKRKDPSARSRGFKFALVGAITAVLCGARKIIIPESGQGALGPSLEPVGHIYPDYRSHPSFGRKMEKFLHALIEFNGQYCYPHIWHTKGETLAHFIEKTGDNVRWKNTRTCWQSNRHVSVDGEARHCGVCAACMLRRMSVHAAGQTEPRSTYVWENLSALKFNLGASVSFGKKKITNAMKHHAVGGTRHMNYLAGLLGESENAPRLDATYGQLSQSLDIDEGIVEQKMKRLLNQHKCEWEEFIASLGPKSFIARWV